MKPKTNSDCVHAWAHQLAPEAKTGNIYFEGPVIYSYGSHFPIARLDGDRVFATLRNYSNTTAKHKVDVFSAVSHKRFVWVNYVPTGPTIDDLTINQNIDYWISQIESLMKELKEHPRRKSLTERISNYIQYINALVQELDIKISKSLQTILSSPSIEAIVTFINRKSAAAKAKAAKRTKAAEKAHLVQVQEFERGAISKIPYNPYAADLAYLRYNPHKQRIETSKEVQVPVETAKRFWEFIRSILPYGCKNTCNYTILDFQVTEISTERIVIGCHTIPMSQVDKIALQLGWQK